MRNITKLGDGGYHLNRSNASPPISRQQASSRWNSFKHKTNVSGFLNTEQYGLCAYSEIRPDFVGLETHIEHIQPKSNYPLRTFDYHNLVLCALSDQDLKDRARDDIFGGHAKLGNYDENQFISPLQNDCHQYFIYLSDGRIEPNNKLTLQERDKAQYTIDLLNLDSPYLINQRKKWLDELDNLIDEHIQNDHSLYHLACVELIPTNQKLNPFFTATRQFFQNIAEQVLNDHAPELKKIKLSNSSMK